MTKRFTTWGNKIKRNGKLLNIEFKTKTDAKLCCKLCNQMDKNNQEYIDELDEIFKWYKEYYGETILDTKMGWNGNNKISKLKKENEQLKKFYDISEDYNDSLVKENEELHQIQMELVTERNSLRKENTNLLDEIEQLKSDKEHLMGCLIRFFGYDDEDIDYNLNRESNREYGKQYYSMKEETKKELKE